MSRLAIITIGKTHSGKTTFAGQLEEKLHGSVVIDQDNHAAFLNTFYKNMLPVNGPNTLKYAVSQTILDFAADETDSHIILCNSNRHQEGRKKVLKYFRDKGFQTILVHFEIPDEILRKRIAESKRSINIFRSASTFAEVLEKQNKECVGKPGDKEADQLFVIRHPQGAEQVIDDIVQLSLRGKGEDNH
ncbi:ATP-binding protein [Bacillus sp. SCS-153A]|uniref:ATP-binding protein n=1 Tax=Rossellomorea sedimentorum TaxID=3115294 RepID=UPI003905DD92